MKLLIMQFSLFGPNILLNILFSDTLSLCSSLNFRGHFSIFVKVKFSLYKPSRPLGLREVETPTFSDIRFIDGVKVVSQTRRPPFTPRKIPGTHFY
jgi:hypothetical protein